MTQMMSVPIDEVTRLRRIEHEVRDVMPLLHSMGIRPGPLTAALAEEEVFEEPFKPFDYSKVVVPDWMFGRPQTAHDAWLLRQAGFLPVAGWAVPR